MSNSQAFIGRVLQANATGFLVGCRVPQLQESGLAFGALVRVTPAENDPAPEIFGIIAEIHLPGDELVRQLTVAPDVPASIHADQHQRNLPVEIQVLSLGYRDADGRIHHLLPPRPPLTLANLYLCTPDEVREFTSAGRMGYFRHILRAQDAPTDELLAVHLRQAREAHSDGGDPEWAHQATRHLITLLRDDYERLTRLLDALGEVIT